MYSQTVVLRVRVSAIGAEPDPSGGQCAVLLGPGGGPVRSGRHHLLVLHALHATRLLDILGTLLRVDRIGHYVLI